MKYLYIAMLGAALLPVLAGATNARLEGMGGDATFIKDENRVFTNPAFIFQYPNTLIGSLGHIAQSSGKIQTRARSTGTIYDTVLVDIPAESSTVDQYSQQQPWFGAWAVYPVTNFKVGAGVIMNRNSLIKENIPQTMLLGINNEHNRMVQILEPRGESELILGVEFEPIQFGYKLYFARSQQTSLDSRKIYYQNRGGLFESGLETPGVTNTYIVDGFAADSFAAAPYTTTDTVLNQKSLLLEHSFGLNYKISAKQEIEASFTLGMYSHTYSELRDSLKEYGAWIQDTAPTPDTTFLYTDTVSRVELLEKETTAKNFLLNVRYRYAINNRTTIIPVFDFQKFSNQDGDDQHLGGGLGVERTLYRGLLFLGASYSNVNQEFSPASTSRYLAGNMERTARTVHRWVYSFGIEKSVIFDWLTLRVGGQKTMDYVSDSLATSVSQNLLEPSDRDVVGFGIALTQGEHLRFDITVSERFTASNLFAGGDNGIMLSRISAVYRLYPVPPETGL